jgi:hypothetical protein
MIQNEEQYLEASKAAGRLVDHIAYSTSKLELSRHGVGLADHLEMLNRDMEEYDKKDARKGDWFPLYSGKRFWPEDPRPQDFDIRDIAHSLARINRFNGQTREAYSVAQHSVLCSEIYPTSFALMHDASEPYIGDIITPIKRLVRRFFDPMEENIIQAIATRFDFEINLIERKSVKNADLCMLATEGRDLTTAGFLNHRVTGPLPPPIDSPITRCWGPEEAEERFLERFAQIG